MVYPKFNLSSQECYYSKNSGGGIYELSNYMQCYN